MVVCKKETAQLLNKEVAIIKGDSKDSKSEQKAKNEVEDEFSQLFSEIKGKHAEVIASLCYSNSNGKEKNDLDSLVKAIACVSVPLGVIP